MIGSSQWWPLEFFAADIWNFQQPGGCWAAAKRGPELEVGRRETDLGRTLPKVGFALGVEGWGNSQLRKIPFGEIFCFVLSILGWKFLLGRGMIYGGIFDIFSVMIRLKCRKFSSLAPSALADYLRSFLVGRASKSKHYWARAIGTMFNTVLSLTFPSPKKNFSILVWEVRGIFVRMCKSPTLVAIFC